MQFATLTARDRLPAGAFARESVEAGVLMSYGTSIADVFRQVGVYAGSILNGANPADLPVVQSTKFEFVLNLQTARSLGIDVPPTLLARADEVNHCRQWPGNTRYQARTHPSLRGGRSAPTRHPPP